MDSVGEVCVFALRQNERLGIGINGSADVDLDCAVISNSPVNQGGDSCMWATRIYAVDSIDGYCLLLPDSDDPVPQYLGYPQDDPFCRSPELCLGEPDNTISDCSADTTNVTVEPDEVTFLPGNRVYCGDLHIEGTAMVGPGLHHIIGGKFKVNSGAVVNAVDAGENIIDPYNLPENISYGSTIFLDSSHKNDIFEINGNSSVTLLAPTDESVFNGNDIVGDSGMLKNGLVGVLFYQTHEASEQSRHKFNGGSEMFLDGAIAWNEFPDQLNTGGANVIPLTTAWNLRSVRLESEEPELFATTTPPTA